ncbi:hypothetical protein [Streptomyces sp. NPDC012510]|uniref:hypothetical protein n=1 Tax=Streptomyces sp. NPDC012510 TaxID=3364838 RepID=UPI0036E682E1
MARLQILELPEGTGDDRPPFVLVVDQITEDEREAFLQSQDATNGLAAAVGARAIVNFHRVTIDIPANDPPFLNEVVEDPKRAGTAQLVDAHERSRLALCDALLLSRDTTWHQLIEQVSERQRELAALHRKLDGPPDAGLSALVLNATGNVTWGMRA